MRLKFENVNIPLDLNKYLSSVTYTDEEEDKADDLQLAFDDRERKWLGGWLKITPTVVRTTKQVEKETQQENVINYTVKKGDTLWAIAEQYLGSGTKYPQIASENNIQNPNLIYPGMLLNLSQTGRIIRTEAKYGGIQMGSYSMDMPYGWRIGVTQSGNAGGNFVLSGDGTIACLVQDIQKETIKSMQDWETQCTQKISDYVKENYADQVSDLSFEHYYMEDQKELSGELYLYSYIWHISPADYPGLTCKVCAGLKMTDHIQAEFLGYTMDEYDIHGCVRYITASFAEDFSGEESGAFTVNSNMHIMPETKWELAGMYNSFAYMDEYFSALLEQAVGTEEMDRSGREKLLDRISR